MADVSELKDPGARLRAARKAAGYTKAGIAELIGVPKSQYQAYEDGAPLPAGLMPILCAVTRCAPQYFLRGEGFPEKRVVYITAGNVSTRLNMCGKPCSVCNKWCTENCQPH